MSYFDKLRPWTHIERCVCPQRTRLVLVDALTDNPIHCFECRKEVDAQLLELDEHTVDQLASWFHSFKALYALWLNSGEYEAYAKVCLLDANGQVNLEGMAIASKMSNLRRTYYWWFHDSDDGVPTHCPNCAAPLDGELKFGTGKCDVCNVVM
jgi:hypothetical protein